MNIWLVKNGEPVPTDDGNPRLMRTGILSQMLAQRGHNVVWWTANTYHQKSIQRSDKTETIDLAKEGYRLILLNGIPYPKKFSIKRVINHAQTGFEFLKHAKKQPHQPDVIVCCYPPIELAYCVARYAAHHKIPLIMDFRDQWPDIIEQALSPKLKILGFPLLWFWRHAQRYCVTKAQAITGISDAFVDWALKAGRRPRTPQDKPFHLAVNPVKPEEHDIEQADAYWDSIGITPSDDVVIGCYAGMLSSRYDLLALINGALALTDDEKKKIRLVLCGTGDLESELAALAHDQPHIILAGWRGAAELHSLLHRSDFGILPYFSLSDFMMSYPNKLGEYFSAGLPVMTCLKGITGALIETRMIGTVYDEGDAASVTAALRQLITQKAPMQQRRPVIRATFAEMFNGETIYPDFCNYIETIAKKS